MSINIKNKEAERLLGEIKKITGKGATDLVLELLRQEKARLDGALEREIADGLESARILREEWNKRPLVDPRPIEEILDYDENGLPR